MPETRRTPKERADDPLTVPEGALLYFVDDLSDILKLTQGAVRKALQRGELGPYFRVGRRLAIRSESLLATLKAREIIPPGTTPPPATRPTPDRDFLEKIRGGKPGRAGRDSRRTHDTKDKNDDSQRRS